MANLAMMVVAFAAFFTIVTSFATTWLDGTSAVAEGFRVARALDAINRRASISETTDCINPLGTSTEFVIVNGGQTPLRNFEQWSLVASYRTSSGTNVEALVYTTSASPSDDQWTVSEIRLKNGPKEVFGPGIIDPGEEATITVKFSPGVWASTTNSVSLTTDTGSVATIDFTGENECGYYLHNNPTPPTGNTNQQANLTADNNFPGQSTLYNYDQDRDAFAGRLIVKGGSGASESVLNKYQNWRTAALAKDLKLAGTVRVHIWAAMKDFNTVNGGAVSVYLRDYNPSTSGYTEIGNATATSTPWDATGSGTWVSKTVSITAVGYTVVATHMLEIKFIVDSSSGDDMWFAYDTVSYPTLVEIPAVETLVLHSEDRLIADTRYNQLRLTAHDAGYYLHNNPTPATNDTNMQANLTVTQVYPGATTLYNYDMDQNAVAGRRIRKGGSGSGESDLVDYQNWRTGAMTADTRIRGDVRLDFWSAVTGFSTSAAGQVTVYLRDYNPSTSGYTEIASATLTETPWDAAASGTWVRRYIEFRGLDYTLVRGRQLEIKIIVGNGAGADMEFAYETTAYASVLLLPGTLEPDPEGKPITEVVDPGTGIGRYRLPSNNGKWVFPLDGYARITDALWTVTYRVKRPAEGWFWRTNAVDVTPTTILLWTNIDLSASIPEDATGVVVELVNTNSNSTLTAGVRGTADTNNYVLSVVDERLRKLQHRYQVVKVDSNREIQGWIESTDVKLKLLGYTLGTDPLFRTVPANITPATTDAWTTVDVSAYVDSDATGVVLFIDAISNREVTGQGVKYGIREVGSTFSATNRELNGRGSTMYVVGLDANKRFDAYIEGPDAQDPLGKFKVYLVAQTKWSLTFYTNDVAVTDPTTGSWQSIDADTYAVPATANGLFLYTYNNSASTNEIGFRHGDSTDDWAKTLWRDAQLQAAMGINASNVWQEYMGDTRVDVSIAAYTMARADFDLHADIDVLVRKANGAIRDTLGTDVAVTTDVIEPYWHTKTATFRPSEYTVVDPTDYLEVDMFVHVTRDPSSAATLHIRIDDNSLNPVDRTSISNVGLYRE